LKRGSFLSLRATQIYPSLAELLMKIQNAGLEMKRGPISSLQILARMEINKNPTQPAVSD